MDKFKRSTARDFRINNQTVDAILNEDAIEEDEEEEEEEEQVEPEADDQKDRPPEAKKLKRS